MANTRNGSVTETGTAEAAVVRRYYDILRAGRDRFDPERLREILEPDLDFEGPIAGHRVGAAPFLDGVGRFVAAARSIETLDLLHDGTGAAALYDARLPGGAVRFAEFFEVANDRIRTLRLLYDPAEYRTRCGS